MLEFNEELHRYTKDGNVYTSVTTFIHKFVIPFEEVQDFWLMYKALQYLADIDSKEIKKYDEELSARIGQKIFDYPTYKYYQKYALGQCNNDVLTFKKAFNEFEIDVVLQAMKIIKSFWKQENKKATDLGTEIHLEKESLQYEAGAFSYENKTHIVHPLITDRNILANLEPGVYPELRVWWDEYKIAGTIDQPIVLPNKKILIRDFKTNKEIKMSNKYQKMKAPVNHLDDCNFNHYSLQLSLYARIMEHYGYEVEQLELEHCVIDRETRKLVDTIHYKVPYLKKEIEDMLNYNNEN